jgi:High-affinity nickel-transport protein
LAEALGRDAVSEISALMIGFLLGIKHATDADHLAAVATLATRRYSLAQSMKHGVAWGIGHSVTLLLFGGVVLVLGTSMPRQVALALELVVGCMLILLGADVLRRLRRQRIHIHIHTHGPRLRHAHAHSHALDGVHSASPHDHGHSGGLPLRALLVGITHGMAGSAALVILSVGAVQSWMTGLLFVALFGAGSIVGMASLSVAIAIPLRLTAPHLSWLYNGLTALIGGVSCALGVLMVYRIGVAEARWLGDLVSWMQS